MLREKERETDNKRERERKRERETERERRIDRYLIIYRMKSIAIHQLSNKRRSAPTADSAAPREEDGSCILA